MAGAAVIGGAALAACGGPGRPPGNSTSVQARGRHTTPPPRRGATGRSTSGSGYRGKGGRSGASPGTIPLPFNPVVGQAMEAIAGRTSVPLQAPVQIPFRGSGYLTALAQAGPGVYAVHLIDVARPLAVNSPLAGEELSPHPFVASFGMITLGVPPGPADPLPVLTAHNADWRFVRSSAPPVSLPLGQGITGTEYSDPLGTVLEWQEGRWTLQVSGADAAAEAAVATGVVSYLHTRFLPPYPGVVAIRVVSSGPAPSTETYMDWVNHRRLYFVKSSHATPANAVETCAMAVTMQTFP